MQNRDRFVTRQNIRLVVKNISIVFSPRGGVRRSLADIVVATPGRLVDHINKNPGFCLEHLRFLVSCSEDFFLLKSTNTIHLPPTSVIIFLFIQKGCVWVFFFLVVIQIIDEADRMIDSMHQLWLSQVVKAVYRSGGGPEATSIFTRVEPTHVTAARYGIKLRLPEEEHNR